MAILTNQQQTAFENIVGKEEIARNEQFLPFPQCFLPNQITVSTFIHMGYHAIRIPHTSKPYSSIGTTVWSKSLTCQSIGRLRERVWTKTE